jgi:hypothetical protein
VATLRARLKIQGFDVERAYTAALAYLETEQDEEEYRREPQPGEPTFGAPRELLRTATRWASRQDRMQHGGTVATHSASL